MQIANGICGEKKPPMVELPKSPGNSPEADSPGKSKKKRSKKKKKSGTGRSSVSADLGGIDEEAGPSGSGGGDNREDVHTEPPSPPPTVTGRSCRQIYLFKQIHCNLFLEN